jgi:hypothetical protein
LLSNARDDSDRHTGVSTVHGSSSGANGSLRESSGEPEEVLCACRGFYAEDCGEGGATVDY